MDDCPQLVGRSVGRVKREPHNLEKYHFPCRFAAAVLSSGKGDKGGGIAGSQHSAGLSLSVPTIGEQSKTTKYRAAQPALKEASQVVWNLGEKLPFVYLLQAGKRNFFTHYSHNLGSIL